MQHAANPGSNPFLSTMSPKEKLEQRGQWAQALQPSEWLITKSGTPLTATAFVQKLQECQEYLRKKVKTEVTNLAFQKHYRKLNRKLPTLTKLTRLNCNAGVSYRTLSHSLLFF